jgi:hypothetical protein
LLTDEEILEEATEEPKPTWSKFVKDNIYNTPYDDNSSDSFSLEQKLQQIKEELSHIQKPYTFEELIDIYSKSDYNSELLLQHALLLLLKN